MLFSSPVIIVPVVCAGMPVCLNCESAALLCSRTAVPPCVLLCIWHWQRVAVLVLALALVVSATAERVTFKILVDRLEGYRYFIMQLVVLANLAVHFVTMLYKMLRTVSDPFQRCARKVLALSGVSC